MSRRVLLLGLVAASQLSTGCWCIRERIAWRWHAHHPAPCGPVCAPACTATPAFRIPSSPVVGAPVVGAPLVGGPVGAPGCAGCAAGMDPAMAGFAVPVAVAGPIGAPPVIGPAMPLGSPRVETPMVMPTGPNPKN